MQFQNAPLASNVTLAPQTKEKRQRIFWFKKEDGQAFCALEEEAWNIMCGRVKIFEEGKETTKKHEYLGASDSNKYFDGIKEMQNVFRTQGLEQAQEFLRELERKELESADKTIRPRNFDKTLNGVPVNFQI